MDYVKEKGKENQSGGHDTATLVLGAAKGDKEALVELCQVIVKGILFRATRIMGNQEGAEDVTQEVLIKVCTYIHELREPDAFYGWLNSIIINESNRYMAKNAKHGVVLNIEDYQETFEETNEEFLPQEHTIRESDRKRVVDAIDRLPEQQRKAVLLYYYDGMTLTEAAKVMGVSQPRVSRCIKMAQEKIKNEFMGWSKGAEGAAAFGLAMLPLDTVLTSVLQSEAALFGSMNAAWAQGLVGNLAANISSIAGSAATGAGGVAAGAAGGAGAKGGNAANAASHAGTIATVATAVAVAAGVLFVAPNLQDVPEPVPIVAAEYRVDFSGGDSDREYVNPTQAFAYVSTEDDEMVANSWWIHADGDDEILFSGDGGTVTDALIQMKNTCETGVYELCFEMEDRSGDTWILRRLFAIERPG